METPSSIRRYTRSLVKDSSSTMNNKISISSFSGKNDESYAKADRSALIDITNDSPIVGLASGSLAGTPSSLLKKRNHHPKPTPGSGEALLRGQVNILLQKVEEETEPHPHHHHQQQQKPSGPAPTPTNTPQVPNLSDINGLHCLIVNEESQEALVFDESPFESDKCDVTRSLLFDFFDKSEPSEDFSSCSSVLTEGSVFVGKSAEDDDASVWSIQVNASVPDEDEQEEFQGGEENYYDEDRDEEEAGLVDELCEGLSKIFVQKKTLPEFEGKHTRFLYNSDGELEGEEVTDDDSSSPANNNGILRLNGLPTPQGKHLRFPEEED